MTLGWPAALALTVAVEVPLAVALAPADRRRRIALDGALLNLLTHPIAWWAVHGDHAPLLPVELAVTAVEGLGYWRVTKLGGARAAAVTCACNALTTLIGLVVARLA